MIENSTLTRISNYIQKRIGLYFPAAKYDELHYKLNKIASEMGLDHVNELADVILNESNPVRQKLNGKIKDILASKLTVCETYFWRDKGLFHELEKTLIPDLTL